MRFFSISAAALVMAAGLVAGLSAPLAAQEQTPPAGTESPQPPQPPQPQLYVAAEHGDWQLRCLATDVGADPCQLYQLLKDEVGNPVAEITLFPLSGDGRAVAGATIATPLDTLLTRQVALSVDGGVARRYPFTYCSVQGCFARVGFTADEIELFKRGNVATISIVPLASPDQTVELKMSLKGFTAGHEALLAKGAAAGGN